MNTPSQPLPNNLSDELKTILDDFARWTIQNVEHGIYIPLPSPQTEAAITAAYAEAINEIIGSDEELIAPDDERFKRRSFRDDVAVHYENKAIVARNKLRVEQRQRLKGLLPNGKEKL